MKAQVSLVASLLALSCSASGGGAGKVTVLLKDAPGDFRAAVVTIDEIALVGDGGSVVLRDTPVTQDLLTLSNDVATLVDGVTVPAGTYTQLRFVIGGGYLDVGGTLYATSPDYAGLPPGATVGGELRMPSYARSGLKVILPDGGVAIGGDLTGLVVDFDVAGSFGHAAGNSGAWVMHPVVKATRVEQTGSVAVTLAKGGEFTLPEGAGLDAFSATLTPAAGGDVAVVPLVALGDGTYGATFRYLGAGDYLVSFQPPAALTAFTTDPPVPAPATVLPGQVTTLDFLLLSFSDAPPSPL
jgi:hypothetical protein